MNPRSFRSRRKLLIAAVLVCTGTLRAAFSIDFSAGQLYTGGGTPLNAGSLVFLVADTTGNGFGALNPGTFTVGSLLNSDDLVIGSANVVTTFGISEVAGSTGALSFSGDFDFGDHLALVWFTTGSNVVTASTAYGLFTTGSPQDGSDAWTAPADPSPLVTVKFLTQINGGFYAESAAYASLTAIPEPATYAVIFGACVLGLAVLRRRRLVRG